MTFAGDSDVADVTKALKLGRFPGHQGRTCVESQVFSTKERGDPTPEEDRSDMAMEGRG